MKKEKSSVIYYKEWAELLIQMPDELRIHAYDAINRFIANGEIPDVKNPAYWVVLNWINQIKRDCSKYEEKCNMNKINGKKGGRPRKPKETEKTERLFLKPKKADNDNDNEDDDEYEYEYDNEDDDDKEKKRGSLSLSIPDILNIIENELDDKDEISWYQRLYERYPGIWVLCKYHYSFSEKHLYDIYSRYGKSKDDDPVRLSAMVSEKMHAIANSKKPFNYLYNKVCEFIEKDYK